MLNLFGANKPREAEIRISNDQPNFNPIGSGEKMDSTRVPPRVGEEALKELSMPVSELNSQASINEQSKLIKYLDAGFPQSIKNSLKGLGLKEAELEQFRAFESNSGKYVVFTAPESSKKEQEVLGKKLLRHNLLRTLNIFADKTLENQVTESLKDSNIKKEGRFRKKVIADDIRIQLVFDTIGKDGKELKKAELSEATYSLSAYDLAANSRKTYKDPIAKVSEDMEKLVDSSSNPQNKEDLKLFLDAFVKGDKEAIETLQKKTSHLIMIEALSKRKESKDPMHNILEMSTDAIGISNINRDKQDNEIVLAGAASETKFAGEKTIEPMIVLANGEMTNQMTTKVKYGSEQVSKVLETLLLTLLTAEKDLLTSQKTTLDKEAKETLSKALIDNLSNVLMKENQEQVVSLN